MNKKKCIKLPGIYHDLTVRFLKSKTIVRHMDDPECLAYYVHQDAEIAVAKDVSRPVMEHLLYHEISHHILDTMAAVRHEEDSCDVLGAYLKRLMDARETIEGILDQFEQK